MKSEEIELLKKLRSDLCGAIDKLEALEVKKEPRELWLYYHDYSKQWRSLDPDEAIALSDDIKVIRVKEVIE